MSRVVVLDAEALSELARERGRRFAEVRAAIEAAHRLEREVLVPAVVLAELYRGRGHNQVVDACLARESAIHVRDTNRTFARYVGGILAGAGVGSEHLVDAHVVAVAVEAGGGVVLTGDEEDLQRLADPYRNVQVVRL